MSDYLFVYGTLRKSPDGPLHPFLQGQADYIGMAAMPGKLYQVENYPGAIACRTENGVLVHGEVYRLYDAKRLLPTLDEYEECTGDFPNPHEYRRHKKTVILTDRCSLSAWVYLYNHPVSNLEQIVHGNYRRYLLEQHRPHCEY